MDAAQVKRACASLLGYLRQREEAAAAKRGGAKKSSLFEAGDVLAAEAIQLVVGLKRTPEQGRSKPIRVPIPHSLYAAEDGASLCMFVKDNSEELQARLRKEPVAGLERVVQAAGGDGRLDFDEYATLIGELETERRVTNQLKALELAVTPRMPGAPTVLYGM